jgi:hypothetical protein
MPPTSKDLIFKWAFNIPNTKNDLNEKDALKHLINVFHPFLGLTSLLDYKESKILMEEPPRNKYFTLQNHYRALVDYI